MTSARLADRGMATVELAAALPVLMLLVLVGLSAVRVGDARVRCVDAAREAARAAARGDPRAVALASQAVPAGARISVLISDGTVTATVSVHVRSLGAVGPSVTVTARASAAAEPQAAEPQAAEPQAAEPQASRLDGARPVPLGSALGSPP